MPVSGALRDYAGSTAGVTAEAVTVDGSKLATGQADGIIRLWNTSDGKQLGELKTGGKSITAMTISVNALWLAAGDADGNVFLFQLSDNKPAGKMSAHTKGVTGLAFHANNQLLYSVGQDGLLKGWNVPFGAESTPYKLEKTTITAAYRALDGRVALACADKTIRVLKGDGTLEKALPAASAEIKVLSLQGNTVIASLADGKVAWWDVTTGTQVHQIDLGKAATSISLRSDGNEFAVALPDGTIKIGEVTKDKTKGADKVINKTIAQGSSTTPASTTASKTTNRLARTKRWQINFGYEDSEEFVKKLSNLKVVVGARLNNGTYNIYEEMPSQAPFEPREMTTGEFQKYANKMQRLWVINKQKDVCESFEEGVGMIERPISVFLFIPQDMEAAILKQEEAFHHLNEIEIMDRKLVTKFDVTRTEGGWNVKVEGQHIDPNLKYENQPVPVSTQEKSKNSVVQYHPTDANVLAIADDKKALKTWLIKENKAEQTITLDAPASQLTWSKDASRLAACVGNQLVIVQPKEGKLVTKVNHTSPVVSGGFGTDTTRLITTTLDGKSHLFDVGNGKELQGFTGKQAILSGLSADPKKLLLCTKEASFIEPITITKLIVGQHPIRGFALMDGGNRAVSVSDDGIGRIYNLANGNIDKELKGHTTPILAVATLANSQIVFTAGIDKSLRCFNAGDGKEMKVLQLPNVSQTLAVQGNTLVAGCMDSSVVVMNVPFTPGQPLSDSFGKVLFTFKQSGPVTGVIMPNISATIYSCSEDKSIKSWKISGDIPQRNLAGHGNLVDAVGFSPDGHRLASCSHDGTIRLWNPHDGKQLGEVKLAPQGLYCLAWRGDGKQLAVGSFDHSIRLINVADKKVEREIKGYDEKSAPNGHNDAVYSVAYVGNDQLYSAGADGKIKLWNINDGGMLKTFVDPALKDKAQRDFINNIRLTKDGKKLVAVGNGGWVTIWNTADGKMLHSQKLPIPLYGLSIHPDGNSFATGNMNGTIYVIKMP